MKHLTNERRKKNLKGVSEHLSVISGSKQFDKKHIERVCIFNTTNTSILSPPFYSFCGSTKHTHDCFIILLTQLTGCAKIVKTRKHDNNCH